MGVSSLPDTGQRSHAPRPSSRAGSVQERPVGRSRSFANTAAADGGLGQREARSRRFQLLDRLGRVTTLKRLSHCRRDRAYDAEWVGIVSRYGLAAYAGLQTCGSAWACPVCSAKVRHQRTLALSCAVLDWVGAGGGLIFPTITLAHIKADRLDSTLGHLLASWRQVSAHRRWKALRVDLGIDHVCRAVETPYGRNGWHPHLHVLLFTRAPLITSQLGAVQDCLWTLHNRYAEQHSLRVLLPSRAVLTRQVDIATERGLAALAEYLFKVQDGYGIAAEVLRGDRKTGKRGSRAPFQIAERAVAGDRRDLTLWHEYEAATHGRHVLDWSRGSARALGMHGTDDDVVRAPVEGAELLYDLTPYEWSLVLRYRRRGYLLNVVDSDGREGVVRALEALRRRDRHEDRKTQRKASRP